MRWKSFRRWIQKGLQIEFKPLTLTDAQLEEVKALEEKFRSDDWTYRK